MKHVPDCVLHIQAVESWYNTPCVTLTIINIYFAKGRFCYAKCREVWEELCDSLGTFWLNGNLQNTFKAVMVSLVLVLVSYQF